MQLLAFQPAKYMTPDHPLAAISKCAARILGSLNALNGVASEEDLVSRIAKDFNKDYTGIAMDGTGRKFACELDSLSQDGFVYKMDGRIWLTEQGEKLLSGIRAKRPALLEKSNSPNISRAA